MTSLYGSEAKDHKAARDRMRVIENRRVNRV